jgi:lipoic acid synthetase
MMVGLGEREEEVLRTLADLHEAGCSVVTIGQYLQPGSDQVPVAAFVEPSCLQSYARKGREMGIAEVVAGPFVRSSYRAREVTARVSGVARQDRK